MSEIIETGICVEVQENHDNPKNAHVFYNPKMSIGRELVLAAVCSYAQSYKQENQCLRCLDACAATGIAGLQWKKQLGSKALVFINDNNKEAAQNIISNCARNDINVARFHENGLENRQHKKHTVIQESAPENAVEVILDDANITMHKQQFHIVYLDPFGCTVQYLDAMFRNIYHGGMAILTCTDVAALYGKCPVVTRRNYGAVIMKTECNREMAVRIMLTEAARAAAKCNKGFEVLYSVGVEHFVQVALRIKRGAKHANQTVLQSNQYLHCVVCSEWGELPNESNPIENPYQYLPCDCKTRGIGQTAFVLGPMWSGNIFNAAFITNMKLQAKERSLSKRLVTLLNLLIEEAQCIDKDSKCSSKSTHSNDTQESKANADTSKDSKEITINSRNHDESNQTNQENKDYSKKNLVNENTGAYIVPHDLENKEHTVEKRKMAESTNTGEKRSRNKLRQYSKDALPKFYYGLHSKAIDCPSIPKMDKTVSLLREAGFRASRTHFDTQSVRTDACLSELKDALNRFMA